MHLDLNTNFNNCGNQQTSLSKNDELLTSPHNSDNNSSMNKVSKQPNNNPQW